MPTHDSSETRCRAPFADRHIHGIAGVDFATSSVTDIRAGLELLAQRRTTQVTASLPTIAADSLTSVLTRLRSLITGGLLAGIHLEGPFIAPEFAGAHPRQAILSPTSTAGKALLTTVLEHHSLGSVINMVTIAPEVAGLTELVQQLTAHNITPALGHTAASYEQMRDGIDLVHAATARPVVITHLYNAMRGFHHRDPGPLLAVLEAASAGKVIVELIADGDHLHPYLVQWWFSNYPEAIRLVSDASAGTLPTDVPPLTQAPARLGHTLLDYGDGGAPRIAAGDTLASGGKDLLAIHDALVAAGLDHDLVCAAMR